MERKEKRRVPLRKASSRNRPTPQQPCPSTPPRMPRKRAASAVPRRSRKRRHVVAHDVSALERFTAFRNPESGVSYEVVSILGKSIDMAILLGQVSHQDADSRVALKVHALLQRPNPPCPLLTEYNVYGRLKGVGFGESEYIPQIYDYFVTLDGSVEVLVMEAFDHSLWSLSHLPLLSMTDDAFCGLALTLCTILDKLHKCGFVHLDIKPENILVRLDSTSTSITKIVLCDVYTATRIAALHFFMDGGTLSYLSLWSHHRTKQTPWCDWESLLYSLIVVCSKTNLPWATYDSDRMMQAKSNFHNEITRCRDVFFALGTRYVDCGFENCGPVAVAALTEFARAVIGHKGVTPCYLPFCEALALETGPHIVLPVAIELQSEEGVVTSQESSV